MSKTIGLIGATIWGNRGAEAMLVTAIGRVRQFLPDAEFVIFSYSPAHDRALVTDPAVTVVDSRPVDLIGPHFLGTLLLKLGLPLAKTAQAMRRCDVLLDVSGLSFVEGREKTLPFNILNMLPALLLGIPVVRLSQAMGPFDRPVNRWAANIFLKRSTHIFARGSQTADFMRQLALPADKWTAASDVAFLYDPAFSLSDENTAQIDNLVTQLVAVQREGASVIGISPSSLVYQKCQAEGVDYLGLFIDLFKKLPAANRFVVLPNATRGGRDTPYNNDLYVINLLRERAAQDTDPAVLDRINWVDYDINTASSRKLLAQCKLVLTSRFHCMISSLCLDKPLVVVGWSHKYAEVMADFGLADFVVDYAEEQLDLCAFVDEILASYDSLTGKIEQEITQVQASSAQQFSYLETLLQ